MQHVKKFLSRDLQHICLALIQSGGDDSYCM